MGYILRKVNGMYGVYQADRDGNPIGEPMFVHEDPEVASAHLNAFMFQPAENKSTSKPYGDVAYADPGYQEDKQKRYPIDTEEHVRAALSYINQKDNAEKYSSDDLGKVKARIIAAARRFGIKVSSEKKDAEGVAGLAAANYRHSENSCECCGTCEYWIGKYDAKPGACMMFDAAVFSDMLCDKWEDDADPDEKDEETPAGKALFTGSSTFAAPADTSGGALVIPTFAGSTPKERQKILLDAVSAYWDKSEKLTLADLI